MPADDAVARADLVFEGVAVDVAVPWRGPVWSSADPVTVTFDVGTVYKGAVPANARVQTVRDSASCGYRFEEGERYLVHVYIQEDGIWATGLCDGNQLIKAATALPPGGYRPGPSVTYPRDWGLWPMVGTAVLAAGALTAVVLLVRARRRRPATPASA